MTKTIRRRALVLAVFILAPAALPAQEATPDLPPAAELIDRYVEALGGRDAIMAQPGSHVTGTFSMPAAGLEATLEVYSAADPDRTITIIEMAGVGTIQEGYTGEHGWSVDPNLGPRLLDGKELAATREGASTLGQLRDASMFSERTTVERAEMNGEACWKVKLVWNSGRETYDCYSVESGLIVATEIVQPSPMGEIPVVSLVSDYEEYGGVLTPTHVVQEMMGQRQIITVDTVEVGPIDPERFAPPAAIMTLIEQKAGS